MQKIFTVRCPYARQAYLDKPSRPLSKEAKDQLKGPKKEGDHKTWITSTWQTFEVTALDSPLPGVLPVEIFVKKSKGKPGARSKNVKLDDKGSCAGGPLVTGAVAAVPAARALREPWGPPCNQNFVKPKSTDRDYVPRPNTARSEGGCLDKSPRRYHYHIRCNIGSSAIPVESPGVRLVYLITTTVLCAKE